MHPLLSIIYGLFQVYFIVASFYFLCSNSFLGNWFPDFYDSDLTIEHYCGTAQEAAKVKLMVDNHEQTAKILELNKQEKAREDAGDITAIKQPSENDVALGKAFEDAGGFSKVEGNR